MGILASLSEADIERREEPRPSGMKRMELMLDYWFGLRSMQARYNYAAGATLRATS